MTFLQLARRNFWRKPLRTVLLIVCVATTFLVYGLTTSFLDGAQGASGSNEDILGVMHAAGIGQPMPLAYQGRIAAEPGVAAVSATTRLRGYVDNERNAVSLSAADPRAIMAANGQELGLTPDLLAALETGRDHVLIGRALAAKQGWQVGQNVTLTANQPLRSEGSRDLRLTIAGVFKGQGPSTDSYFLIGRYDYVNAARIRDKDTADVFVVRPQPGVNSSELAMRIDTLFANSAAPTQTQSEKQFLEAFLRQYADVGLIVNLVVGASVVTLLMIVTNTMIFAVRERFFEIGVLKTLGFSRARIAALILTETMFVFVLGGLLGLGLTRLAVFLTGDALELVFSPQIIVKCAALAVGLALLTGLLPALNTMRIPVTAAFRKR